MARPRKGNGEPVNSTGRNHPVIHHGTARHPFAGGRVSRGLDPEGTGARKAPGGPKCHPLTRANRSGRTSPGAKNPGPSGTRVSMCVVFRTVVGPVRPCGGDSPCSMSARILFDNNRINVRFVGAPEFSPNYTIGCIRAVVAPASPDSTLPPGYSRWSPSREAGSADEFQIAAESP